MNPRSPVQATEGFDPAVFEELAALEAASFWFRGRAQLLAWALRRHFGERRTFLEIGTGTGYTLMRLLEQIPDMSVVGSDLFAEGLRVARRRLQGMRLVQLDGRAVPFRERFDLIGAFDVLEHVEEDEVMIGEMRDALCAGGGLVLTVPQHPWLRGPMDEVAQHVRRYTRRDVVAKVTRAGFDILRVTSFVTLSLPLLVASRLILRPRRDPLGELKLRPALNRMLGWSLNGDIALIRIGVSLPVGGSMLVVAKKADAS